MKPYTRITAALLCTLSVLCSCSEKKTVTVSVSDVAVSRDFIGNGVEWDPYDEAAAWGSELSDADWQTLYSRLDHMRPGYVRCMINSPYKYYVDGSFRKENNIADLCKLLDYCQKHDITVVYGEFNPPDWSMKDSPEWVRMSVDYLEYLVCGLGYDCIKYFVIFNEPDGNWASTNGDFGLWSDMLRRFAAEIASRDALKGKVSFAGPDVVLGYHNGASKYDALGWVKESAAAHDDLIGVYDIHSYPSQSFVRSGEFKARLESYRQAVPEGKKIILGEAGFKYDGDPRDAELQKTNMERAKGHPFTKGNDSNMLVYDYFYGLDMAMLAMDVMNSGFSGAAAWMLDDAMHSSGDSGKTEDVKIWGMWNILGSEVFGKPEEEDIKPWYYSWSLMCRFFPAGCDILGTEFTDIPGIRAAAASKDGKRTIAIVNTTDEDLVLKTGIRMKDARTFIYEDTENYIRESGKVPTTVNARSLMLITEME